MYSGAFKAIKLLLMGTRELQWRQAQRKTEKELKEFTEMVQIGAKLLELQVVDGRADPSDLQAVQEFMTEAGIEPLPIVLCPACGGVGLIRDPTGETRIRGKATNGQLRCCSLCEGNKWVATRTAEEWEGAERRAAP